MRDFFMSALRKVRLLTLLVVVASLAFMVRVGDTVFQIKNLGSAYAEDAKVEDSKAVKEADNAAPPKDALPTAAEAEKAATDKKTATTQGEPLKIPEGAGVKDSAPTETAATPSASKKKWEDSDTDFDDTATRQAVYDDLMQRRQMIEQKETDIEQREALLKAGTEEMNKKLEELNAIKTEIQGLLKKQNDEDNANASKLVKIYEGMKPKDAAKIFNQLDMDVLLNVVSRMSERKVSPIIALMDPQKAKALTDFLSQQNKLPGTGSTTAGFGNPSNPPPLPESAVR